MSEMTASTQLEDADLSYGGQNLEEVEEENAASDSEDEEGGSGSAETKMVRSSAEKFYLLFKECSVLTIESLPTDASGDSEQKEVKIPLTRLPATIGRTHKSKDKSFVGLGEARVLSRNHFAIYYRDASGGRIGQYSKEDTSNSSENDSHNELVYKPKQNNDDSHDKRIVWPNREEDDDDDNDLPATGFFAIECLGKNKIFVGQRRVDQGRVAIIEHGTPLKIASYKLYFLLPDNNSEKGAGPATIMRVPNPAWQEYQTKKRTRAPISAEASDDDDDNSKARSPGAKRHKGDVSVASSVRNPTHGMTGLALTLEAEKTRVLLVRMLDAVENGRWERKDQMVGSAIALHAVRDAARSPKIRKLADESDGVSRADIIEWIGLNDMYAQWTVHMMEKMEYKSYQASISKALLKAGFTRRGTTGRHVKWNLPPSAVDKQEEENESNSSQEEEPEEGEEKIDDKDDEHKKDEDDESESDINDIPEPLDGEESNDDSA
eukprot:scaffold64079_cov54-Attheya_sp.AAC.1